MDLLDTRERPHDAWLAQSENEDRAPAATAADRKATRTAWASADGGAPAGQPLRRWEDGVGAATPMQGRLWAGRWRQRRPRAAPPEKLEQGSLFGEILDWMFTPLLLLWPLSVAVTFLVARSLADAPFDRALSDRTEALAQQVRTASGPILVAPPRAAKEVLASAVEDVVYFQVIGPRNTLLAGVADLPRPGLYDFPTPGQVNLRTTLYRDEQVRIGYIFLEVVDDGEIAPVLVQVAETLDKRSRLANEIIKGVIFPQFLILPVAMMLVWFGLSRGLAPLKSLQRRIRRRAPDDLSPIDARGTPEEIAPLVDAFNELLERLGRNVSVQKRFIADAAHQMKTPLAGLRTQSELALRERDPVELRRALEQIARSSGRTAHLISQLLSLARTENLGAASALSPIDLVHFTREAVSDWVPAAIERGIDLGFETIAAQYDDNGLEASGVIEGQPILLRELLNNLIDNALQYTPRGGAATVRVVADGDHVHVEVEDTGPGIAEAERELVFERFYRVLGTGVDGSGLGLPIVQEIADQHGASVRVAAARADPQAPGTRFTVTFPASPSPRTP